MRSLQTKRSVNLLCKVWLLMKVRPNHFGRGGPSLSHFNDHVESGCRQILHEGNIYVSILGLFASLPSKYARAYAGSMPFFASVTPPTSSPPSSSAKFSRPFAAFNSAT